MARNVSVLFAAGIILVAIIACGNQSDEAAPNTLNSEEKAEGWELLFDGENLEGFHALPGGQWEVRDGMIIGTSPASEQRHGLLVTDREYDDFTLRLQYKALEGNSGVYFRAEEVEEAVGVHGFQAEVDADGQSVGGLYETGGRQWVVQPDQSDVEQFYKPDQWNDMTIRADGGDIVVHVNGVKTAELQDDPGRKQGHIALQLHGGMEMQVLYKNLKILEGSGE